MRFISAHSPRSICGTGSCREARLGVQFAVGLVWQVQNDSRGGWGGSEGNPGTPRQRKQTVSSAKSHAP